MFADSLTAAASSDLPLTSAVRASKNRGGRGDQLSMLVQLQQQTLFLVYHEYVAGNHCYFIRGL